MELQLAVQSARSTGRSHVGGTATAKDSTPGYLRPSTGSCHHVCKYGGTHAFEERDAHAAPRPQPRPRKQQQTPAPDQQHKRSMIRARFVPRKLFGDRTGRGGEKVATDEGVEWKDIVAYDAVPDHHGSVLPELDDQHRGGTGSAPGDVKKTRGKKSSDTAKITGHVDAVKSQNESSPGLKQVTKSARSKMSSEVSAELPHGKTSTDTKTVKPPRGKKKPAVLVAKKKALDQELIDGYHPLSPSLLQNRASLLRDLQQEMVHEATNVHESKAALSLGQEEIAAAAAAAETSRPVPAHRRAKSMSVSLSSRSVRFPFTRQASKNSSSSLSTFKLRSRSSRAGPVLPPGEEETAKPAARVRSRRGGSVGGGDEIGGGAGRGIQLRIRSLRRRGLGAGGGASAGFVVPAVALRHQKTLEKKRSQRLSNNVIEETASRLVKTRKSRVKALVGAFESVISKIAK